MSNIIYYDISPSHRDMKDCKFDSFEAILSKVE